MAEPQRPLKTIGMTYEDKLLKFEDIPEFVELPPQGRVTIISEVDGYQPETDIDYTDLSAVNMELQKLRIRLHRVRVELKRAERDTLRERYAYESQKKRTWIKLTGGTAGEREAMAELMCTEAYTRYLVAGQVAKELTQLNRDLRTDLDTLKEISNNLRRIVDLQ